MDIRRGVLIVPVLLFLALLGCTALKESKPILPQKEYEKLIYGRFDADYVGTNNCLKACHYHDRIRRDFEASTMGAQMSPDTGMPLVDCESCHGPGSLAIANLSDEKVREDSKAGRQSACDYTTLIDLNGLPSPAKSLICLRCHTANATFNLHNWGAGEHSLNDVSCFDCHKVHVGPDLKVKPKETFKMCLECHEDVRAEFSLPSHHPVPEEKVRCTDCHDPHGTVTEHLLKKETVKATCTQCHPEKEGPYVFEHADNTSDCTVCHSPHGSISDYLLVMRMPFLCLQCHEGHGHEGDGTNQPGGNPAFYTRCTDCHSQIHGTDLPSPSKEGTFLQ